MKKNIFCLNDGIGHVQLVQHVGDDAGIVNSARVSFGKRIDEVQEKDIKLIEYLLTNQHCSPLEHNSITFLVKCPIFIARQWMRHRICSYNEISARYTELKDEFYIPENFRIQHEKDRQASKESDNQTINILKESYVNSLKESYANYKKLLDAGVAREQARGLLPLCIYTEFYWTCNLRALLHFIELRADGHAQWEMQQYARAVLVLVNDIFPETIKAWKKINKL